MTFDTQSMSFDIARNVILAVDSVEIRMDPGQHPFEIANHAEIERNWSAEKSRRPALFDGTVVLLSELRHSAGRLLGRCHAIRYATFLHWRNKPSAPGAEHVFAQAMLVSRDNALIAIRMASHTANAGSVYFAAGSFEPIDFVDGVAAVDLNMIREVGEETGLDIGAARRDKQYHVLSTDSGTMITRRHFLDLDAEAIAGRIRGFVAAEAEPEIDGPVVIRGPHDLPAGLKPYMRPLVEWHFSGAD